MAEVKLGELCDESTQRDAVHVAVVPMVAKHLLRPGDHIGLVPGTTDEAQGNADCIGIVDPLLPANVRKGQRFLMWLYPGAVTGMRHHWEHPAFPDGNPAVEAPKPVIDMESEKLFAESVAKTCGKSLDALMDDAEQYNEFGNYEMDNSERYKEVEDWPRFWRYFAAVTGRQLSEEVTEYGCSPYTCSC